MPAIECLVCGTSVYSLSGTHLRCHSCGGEHFYSTLPGRGEARFPPTYYPGDHASVIYATDRRLLDTVIPYIRGGFKLGQRVMAVVSDEAKNLICAALRVDEVEAIEFSTPEEMYGSKLDADFAYGQYLEAVERSERSIRCFGGLSRALAVGDGVADEMRRLEQDSERLFESGMTALCLYDARYCGRDLLDLAAEHSVLAGTELVHVR